MPTTGLAQESRPARVAFDTAMSAEGTRQGTGVAGGLMADAMVAVALDERFQVLARPLLQRQPSTGEWNAQLWLAVLRYERPGEIAVRIDGGYVPSPIGLANLLVRPQTNATISLPASLYTALPRLAVGAPRTPLLGAIYPLGVALTVSATRWDVRGALIDTSPARPRRVFSDGTPPNPPRLATVVLGGGWTPVPGLRLGASVSQGGWERARESPASNDGRPLTLATIEADISFGHTRVLGEWARGHYTTQHDSVVGTGWFVQAEHALTPRWFVAGRLERLTSPAIVSAPDLSHVVREPQDFDGTEFTAGYRLSPDLTLRLAHRARQPFGEPRTDHALSASLVWWHRWR